MARVLIVTTYDNGAAKSDLRAMLDTLGIEHDTLVVFSGSSYRAQLHPIAGVSAPIDPASGAMRTLMQRYQAVFVVPHQDANSSFNGFDPTLNTWMLNWNASNDPPVFHFGQPITTARTGLLPSPPDDFPIIKGDTANVANTMWRWESGVFTRLSGLRNRIGTRVRFVREQLTVYARAYNYFFNASNDCAAYLIDTTKPGEGSAWERLIVPDFPDQARLAVSPTNTAPVFGLRYRNHYFLPALVMTETAPLTMARVLAGYHGNSLIWALYALKLAEVAPVRRVPLVMEFDHFVESGYQAVSVYGRLQVDQLRVTRDFLVWLRDFGRSRGVQVVYTNHSAGKHAPRANPGSFYNYLYYADVVPSGQRAEAQAIAEEVRQLLVRNPEVFLCGIHDHMAPGSGFNGTRWNSSVSIMRHDDTGYPFAAPNPIPTQHGTVINRKVAPAMFQPDGSTIFAFEVDGESLLDINPPTTVAQTYNAQDGNYWTACAVIERNIADHRALGLEFFGGAVGYTNHAKNYYGGKGYLAAMRRFGLRGFRVEYNERTHSFPPGDPRRLTREGIQFVPTIKLDLCFNIGGLYHSGAVYSDTGFGMHKLESGTELRGANNEWMSDPSGWRAEKGVVAIRRYLSAAVDMWLWEALVYRGTAYAHPVEATWVASATALEEPFSGVAGNQVWAGASEFSRFHFIKEIFVAMDAVVQLLSDYLKWGTISELMAMRKVVA